MTAVSFFRQNRIKCLIAPNLNKCWTYSHGWMVSISASCCVVDTRGLVDWYRKWRQDEGNHGCRAICHCIGKVRLRIGKTFSSVHGKIKNFRCIVLREFELSFVVEFKEDWVLWMEVLEMYEVLSRIVRGMSAFLTHVQLVSPLFVGELEVHAVHLTSVWLQWTPLGEGLAASLTFIWPDSWNESMNRDLKVDCPWENKQWVAKLISWIFKLLMYFEFGISTDI